MLTDRDYMGRAIDLARHAVGTTRPNPPVGAVVVDRSGAIVGEGFTQPPGQAHAEVVALQQAGPRARDSTLYVTLEPCSHWGRTPPCTDSITSSGVQEIHVAVVDPNPRVNGSGLVRLEERGLHVKVGERGADAGELIEEHAKYMASGTPLVSLFCGDPLTRHLDGRLADVWVEPRDDNGSTAVLISRSVDPVPKSLLLPHAPELEAQQSVLRQIGAWPATSVMISTSNPLHRHWLRLKLVDKVLVPAERYAMLCPDFEVRGTVWLDRNLFAAYPVTPAI